MQAEEADTDNDLDFTAIKFTSKFAAFLKKSKKDD